MLKYRICRIKKQIQSIMARRKKDDEVIVRCGMASIRNFFLPPMKFLVFGLALVPVVVTGQAYAKQLSCGNDEAQKIIAEAHRLNDTGYEFIYESFAEDKAWEKYPESLIRQGAQEAKEIIVEYEAARKECLMLQDKKIKNYEIPAETKLLFSFCGESNIEDCDRSSKFDLDDLPKWYVELGTFYNENLHPVLQKYTELDKRFEKKYLSIMNSLEKEYAQSFDNIVYGLKDIIMTGVNKDTGSVTCKATLYGHLEEWGGFEKNIEFIIEQTIEGQIRVSPL